MKKAQFDFPILTISIIVVIMFILFIVFMRFFNTLNPAVVGTFGNLSGTAQPYTATAKSTSLLTNSWDYVFAFFFIFILIGLGISLVFIQSHPIWTFLFIVIAFFTILLNSALSKVTDTLYDTTLSTEASGLPLTNFLRSNFVVLLVGISLFALVLAYSKFKSNQT